ncbi:6-phosphogluconate dehydrogenase [Phlyctema vagabunda]|uniref:6-phosphogluconate dehydrogenase n=1 Tax=Phlyctema vagabunda TaxID=108571 RepID=A0ABR4PN09_9HELO
MPPLATVGILSIGEMGMGIAKLLIAHDYHVVTNIEGRSEDTHARALQSKIETLPTDEDLIQRSDYILSIVPPRDALATAQRITRAWKPLNRAATAREQPLYYIDLNAISPRSAREIGSLFATSASEIRFLDGGIIGGPPCPAGSDVKENTASSHPTTGHAWKRPSIHVSGAWPLSDAPVSGAHLGELLNMKHLSAEIGPASGLKCCFASTSKGFTAICIQAFTTAAQLGVLGELQDEMRARAPGLFGFAAAGVTSMPPKAYRWVREMHEIGDTHADEGGFANGIFNEVAEVYRQVADETVLGLEKTERRKRGRDIQDVATAMAEGLQTKRKKVE